MNPYNQSYGESGQYPNFSNEEGQYWTEENQVQHDQIDNRDFHNQQYDHTQYEQSFPNQQERQFPWFPGGFFPGFPGGQSPGTGFPGQPGGQFPGQGRPPFGGGGQSGPPNTPPPSFTPATPQFQTFAVDPGAIRGCLFRFTYVWLNRDQFWFFPTFVGRNSVAGFRWRRNRWVYFGIDLNRIQSFQCY